MYKVLIISKNQKLDFFHIKSYGKLKWRALSQIATNLAQIWDLSSAGQGDHALESREKFLILNHTNAGCTECLQIEIGPFTLLRQNNNIWCNVKRQNSNVER